MLCTGEKKNLAGVGVPHLTLLVRGLSRCMELLGICSAPPKLSGLHINPPNLGHLGTNPGGGGVSLGSV